MEDNTSNSAVLNPAQYAQGTIDQDYMYGKVSNIRRTKCQNLNDSRLVLQLSVPNPLKQGVKSRMKM